MYIYDVRYQNRSAKFDAHTSDGLNLLTDVAFRFRVTKRNVPLLHKYIGPDYVEKLILPSLGARVREEVSRHTPEQVYSTKRLEIQKAIGDDVRREFNMDPEADKLLQRVEFIELDEIFLRDVELPESLQKSMVEKNHPPGECVFRCDTNIDWYCPAQACAARLHDGKSAVNNRPGALRPICEWFHDEATRSGARQVVRTAAASGLSG